MTVWTLLFAGCSFHDGALIDGGGSVNDAPDSGGDATVDPDANPCGTWQPHHFDACAIPPSPGAVHLTSTGSPYTYDTSSGGGTLTDTGGSSVTIASIEITQPGGVLAALWSTSSLALDAGVELRVIGSKPLIIAAWDTITVSGIVDAGSHVGGRTGAGSNPAACAGRAAVVGVDGASGTGGGGGGGFQGTGGRGGDGDGNGTLRAGGAGGTAVPAPTIAIGGCDGAASGMEAGLRGAGGRGGGGLVLAARMSITVSGQLLAGGAGGGGDTSTTVSYGGGGGGAGGLIGLDAPAVDVSGATIAANGGGGGGGALISTTATNGQDGAAGGTAAAGGGGTAGEVGGAGSSVTLNGTNVSGTVPNGGGGGGGGAAGFVLYWTPSFGSSSATVSPPAAAGP